MKSNSKNIIVGIICSTVIIACLCGYFYYKYSYKQESEIKNNNLISKEVKKSLDNNKEVPENVIKEANSVLQSIDSLYKQLNTSSLVVGTFDNHLKLTEATHLNRLKIVYSHKYNIDFDDVKLSYIDKNISSIVFKMYNEEKSKVVTVVGKYYIKDKQLEIENVFGEIVQYGSAFEGKQAGTDEEMREFEKQFKEKVRKEKENKGNE